MQINRGLAAIVAVLLLVVGGVAGIYLAPMIQSGAGVESIDVGERYQGELTTEAPLNIKDGSRYRKLSVDLAAEEVTVFTLESSFPGALTLYDENMQRVATSQSDRWSVNQGDRQSTELSYRADEGGRFFLVASGAEENSYGPFSITSETMDVDTETALTGTGEAGGWLQGADDTRTLEIEESGLYIINLTSNAFDTTLGLSGNGVSQQDDDGGDGTNSRIQAMLEPGTYEITVSSYGSSEANGLYTLSVESRELPGGSLRNGGPLEAGETISGILQGNQSTFTLTVDETGLFTFDLSSDNFDTKIFVEGNGVSLENDDGGDGVNSLLETPLEPGEYTVRVEAYGSGSGLFTLSTSRSSLPEGAEMQNDGDVAPGANIRGMLSRGTSNSYRLVVDQAGQYTINARSSSFDTYLELSGNGVSETDDDGGSGTNSQLQLSLRPGEYQLIIRDVFDTGSGMYQLEIR